MLKVSLFELLRLSFFGVSCIASTVDSHSHIKSNHDKAHLWTTEVVVVDNVGQAWNILKTDSRKYIKSVHDQAHQLIVKIIVADIASNKRGSLHYKARVSNFIDDALIDEIVRSNGIFFGEKSYIKMLEKEFRDEKAKLLSGAHDKMFGSCCLLKIYYSDIVKKNN